MVRPFTVDGAFVTPAILDVDGRNAPDEEIFAPVLQVRRADSFEQAVGASQRHPLRPFRGPRQRRSGAVGAVPEPLSRAGVVNLNRPTTGAAGSMPFGGLGESGNHRPSAYYAADYCAYPVASFEAAAVADTTQEIKGLKA